MDYIISDKDYDLVRSRLCDLDTPGERARWNALMAEHHLLQPVVRGRDCSVFERCPMRRGDGACFCWQARKGD